MEYIPPIGGAPDAPYVDANPSSGIEGSPVSAAAVEHPQREIMAVITGVGMAPDGGDLTQLRQAIQQMIVSGQKAVIINDATFEASIADGKPVRWDSANNRYDEAIADGTVNNRAVGIADVTNSKVYLFGECPLFSGLTPNARYYLDAATPGAITPVAAADGVKIGFAKSATTLWVDIDPVQATGAVPTMTTLTSGSGTYNTPAGARALIVRMVGGGGGGAGGGSTGSTVGGVGGTTSFGTVNAAGGSGGQITGGSGGAGGTGGSGAASFRAAGSSGWCGFPTTSSTTQGGSGGGSVFAGGGGPSGVAGRTNTGGGGAGGSGNSGPGTGGGGGGGEYAEVLIANPAATYSYAVGAGGSAGAAGSNGTIGAAGGSGVIVITALY